MTALLLLLGLCTLPGDSTDPRSAYDVLGYRLVKGTARLADGVIRVTASNDGSDGTSFHVPLDFAWREGKETRTARLWLDPGESESEIPCDVEASHLELVHANRVLGNIAIALGG